MAHPFCTERNTLCQMLAYRHDQSHSLCTQEAHRLAGETTMKAQNGQHKYTEAHTNYTRGSNFL